MNDPLASFVRITRRVEAYLDQAEAYRSGIRASLPDAKLLEITETDRVPGGSILNATAGEDELGPFIEVTIEDRDAPDERRTPRYVDPWYFLFMLLAEVAGGRFRFDRSKRQQYYFLTLVGPKKEGNFSLRRIIANTPQGSDTRQTRGVRHGHYDYRRVTLKPTKKRVVRSEGYKTRSLSRGRDAAIAFVTALLQQQRTGPSSTIAPGRLDELLNRAIRLADEMQTRRTQERGD